MNWGDEINGEKCYPVHAGQADILRSKARFNAAIAGTGGGKTVTGPLWVMQEIATLLAAGRDTRKDPILGLIIAPTYQIMARATAPTLVQMFQDTDLEGLYVESKNRYYLPGGVGILWLLSADRPYSLEGGQFDFAWLDEGGQLKYDAWVAVQGRLGKKLARALITTTPYGLNWLKKKFYDNARREVGQANPTYYCRQWDSIENPAYPRKEYDRQAREMSPERFSQRYRGQFVKFAGLIWPDLSACVEGFGPEKLESGFLYGGMDWGWTHPFAAVAGSFHPEERKLYVWYERYRRNVTVKEHAASLPHGVTWWADGSRPENIRDMRDIGHAVRPNRVRSVEVGLDVVNEWIYSRRVVIHPNCKALIAEAEEYAFPVKDDEVEGEKPVKEFDDACDAFRYLLANLDKRVARKEAA